jgi:hypothetical protein
MHGPSTAFASVEQGLSPSRTPRRWRNSHETLSRNIRLICCRRYWSQGPAGASASAGLRFELDKSVRRELRRSESQTHKSVFPKPRTVRGWPPWPSTRRSSIGAHLLNS